MGNMKFYNIDVDYLLYLKKFDNKIPNFAYDEHNKFFCGIVLAVGEFDYYAPITSFKQQQKTNVVIYDKKQALASIRFCFMFPAPIDVLTVKDFSKEEYKYKNLLLKEYKFCKKNKDRIITKAERVYNVSRNKDNPLTKTCCNFKLLEQKCREYKYTKQAFSEVATGKSSNI